VLEFLYEHVVLFDFGSVMVASTQDIITMMLRKETVFCDWELSWK